jgi:hypothetical protein
MCVICDNEYEGLNNLNLKNCKKVTTIPIIEGLIALYIENCINIVTIPIIEGLKILYIKNCYKITNIPVIEGLEYLSIFNCNNINAIPIIEGLKGLWIVNCHNIINYYYDHNLINFYTIERFNSINKIKKWYPRIKFSRKLWMYAELVIIDEMNPHKDDNQYLEKYIKDKVYKE